MDLYSKYASTHAGESDVPLTRRVFERDLLPFLPRRRDARILDVGCGQGALVEVLQSNGYPAATGLDISPEQVAIAVAKGRRGVTLGDFRSHPDYPPEHLDAVTATDFFEHLTKSEVISSLTAVYRLLKPGGLMVARVPNAISPFGGLYQEGDFTHLTSFTPKSVRQVATAAGFEVVAISSCQPLVTGFLSRLRWCLWQLVQVGLRIAIMAETGARRETPVTQNLIFVARRPVT